jgi:hypothetical protein
MTDTYVEVGGANLKCLAEEVSLTAENKPIEVTTFCGIQDYPGPVKYHFVAKFVQAFDTGATDATLSAALTSYQSTGAPVAFKVRPYASRPESATNPQVARLMIHQPYTVFGGAADTQSEADIDYPPGLPPRPRPVSRRRGATWAPRYFTPSGDHPANLAGLLGHHGQPATA